MAKNVDFCKLFAAIEADPHAPVHLTVGQHLGTAWDRHKSQLEVAMVKLLLQRKWCVKDATIGELFLNGQFEAFTLEDVVRPAGQKVQNATAIPTGTYRVVVDWSPRFQKNMLHIMDVPGFDGIRIHSGNTAEDTDGCLLVGQTVDLVNGSIGASRIAYEQLFRKLADEAAIVLEIREI